MSCLFNCKTWAYSQMVSPRGVLACGGPDGLNLYNLNSLKKIKAPLHDITSHSKVTALAWLMILTEKDCGDTLSFGTQKGWLAVWQQESGTDWFAEIHAEVVSDSASIMCLAADTNDHETSSYCLALGTQSMQFRTQSVCFWYNQQTHVDCNRQGWLYLRILYALHTHLYTNSGTCTAYEFYTNAPIRCVLKQVCWAKEDKVLVVGSDVGIVYVFDVETRKKVKILYHSENAFVQSITTHTTSESSYIICGLTDEDKEPFVSLWIKSNPSKPIIKDLQSNTQSNPLLTIGDILSFLFICTRIHGGT
ncbi:uncharacterized protein FOMMEDRAFT_24966 [Fomitiporia mediterranea MF3/22]|uniref:uncharacterized protein n=1 Tax=Fomitiporia mediterranea (strain MF3/22) TaxID=694068 RepID=UPI0004407D33|nr:uncharacterized protein FOMMEDRAFT_24966 [Fomitiporia mediterranea MF3/22]EJD07652.1 hypothetical protein FOMMEDRAFT_24966 [Fomitiporia mediterranea MF3/22]